MSRSYGQYCGLARALDVVGDRWNLLIVRQLLMAPARYRELLDGLPGVATNLLADRLRDLEAAGVVQRRLAEEGNAIVYALTPWGAELREPVEGLIRWSTPLMTRGPGGDQFRAEWLVVALPALLGDKPAGRRPSTVGIAVDGHLLQVRTTRSGTVVSAHDGRDLDAVVRADAPIILGLAAGVLDFDDTRGLVDIEGDEAAVRAVFKSPTRS
ncbi:MAG: helix-turn-helix transcriptional regulator [Actinobacteria bacterium]|nr:helix-turn-helix transcriptional regulator [Actinomycetota bacterium]